MRYLQQSPSPFFSIILLGLKCNAYCCSFVLKPLFGPYLLHLLLGEHNNLLNEQKSQTRKKGEQTFAESNWMAFWLQWIWLKLHFSAFGFFVLFSVLLHWWAAEITVIACAEHWTIHKTEFWSNPDIACAIIMIIIISIILGVCTVRVCRLICGISTLIHSQHLKKLQFFFARSASSALSLVICACIEIFAAVEIRKQTETTAIFPPQMTCISCERYVFNRYCWFMLLTSWKRKLSIFSIRRIIIFQFLATFCSAYWLHIHTLIHFFLDTVSSASSNEKNVGLSSFFSLSIVAESTDICRMDAQSQ